MDENEKEDQHREVRFIEEGGEPFDVIVVGAGAAGVGVAIALSQAGVENLVLIDRDTVGASFASWPEETRFITPSFPSNSIGMLDLNSIAIGVSPAFNMRVEHPTGKEYAAHLRELADYFELPLLENTDVLGIEKERDLFLVKTEKIVIEARNVIWAAGEYQYPSLNAFDGSEHCRHTSSVHKYADLKGDDFMIIGGYESGIDAAYHLAKCGKNIRVFDMNGPWEEASSDPSLALSTYSFERIEHPHFREHVELIAHTTIHSVTFEDGVYELKTQDGQTYQSKERPLLASGFDGSHKFVSHLFEQREDGFPTLTDRDESTIVPGMYLCGPSVRHDGHIFCFIFKYRQRFAIVAQAIASSLNLPTEDFIRAYRGWGMYLDDLSCCGQECLTC